MFSKMSTHGSGLLWAQVNWLVLLILVEFAQILFLCLVNHGENTGDRFPHNTAEMINYQSE